MIVEPLVWLGTVCDFVWGMGIFLIKTSGQIKSELFLFNLVSDHALNVHELLCTLAPSLAPLCINTITHYSLQNPDEEGLDYALNRALDTWYNDRDWLISL